MFDSQAIFMRTWGVEPSQEMVSLTTEIRRKKPSLAVYQASLLAKRRFQKHIYTLIKPRALLESYEGEPLPTIHPREYLVTRWRTYFWKDDPSLARGKLEYWWKNIRKLYREVPPRVHFACILLGHHGWPTARRCGKGKYCPCPLCDTGTDDVFHLLKCKTVRAAFCKVFGESYNIHRQVDALLLSADLSVDLRIGAALLCHGIYTVCNLSRHSGCKSAFAASLIVDHAAAAAQAHKISFSSWLRLCKERPKRNLVVAFDTSETA
jgi:hypothetical protein